MSSRELTGYPSIDKPWSKFYSDEALNGPLPESTIYEFLWENNKHFPNDIAINYYGHLITYKEMFAQIDKTASALLALDVEPGEYVSVPLPSIPEALYVVYGVLQQNPPRLCADRAEDHEADAGSRGTDQHVSELLCL